MVLEIGRVVMKIAGRSSGKIGIVVDKIEKGFVLVDGDLKRKKYNILHLEPLDKVVKIKKGASSSEIKEILKKEGLLKEKKKKFKREKKKKEEKKEIKKSEKEKKAKKKK
jgi:large subunit ribosomal protein L14e